MQNVWMGQAIIFLFTFVFIVVFLYDIYPSALEGIALP